MELSTPSNSKTVESVLFFRNSGQEAYLITATITNQTNNTTNYTQSPASGQEDSGTFSSTHTTESTTKYEAPDLASVDPNDLGILFLSGVGKYPISGTVYNKTTVVEQGSYENSVVTGTSTSSTIDYTSVDAVVDNWDGYSDNSSAPITTSLEDKMAAGRAVSAGPPDDDGPGLGTAITLTVIDTFTFGLIDSVGEARAYAWQSSGYAGTWVETATGVVSTIAREAAITALTGGVATAARAIGVGAVAAARIGSTVQFVNAARDVYSGLSNVGEGISSISEGNILIGAGQIAVGAFEGVLGVRGLRPALHHFAPAVSKVAREIVQDTFESTTSPCIKSIAGSECFVAGTVVVMAAPGDGLPALVATWALTTEGVTEVDGISAPWNRTLLVAGAVGLTMGTVGILAERKRRQRLKAAAIESFFDNFDDQEQLTPHEAAALGRLEVDAPPDHGPHDYLLEALRWDEPAMHQYARGRASARRPGRGHRRRLNAGLLLAKGKLQEFREASGGLDTDDVQPPHGF